MQNNFPKDKNNNSSKNDSRDEILYKFEQSIKIFSLMKNPNYFFQEYRKFIQKIRASTSYKYLSFIDKIFLLIIQECHTSTRLYAGAAMEQ